MSDTALSNLRPPPPKKIRKSRTPGIVFVIIFHAFLIYALVSGLANTAVELVQANIEVDVVDEAQQDETPPPPPPPDFKPPPPDVIVPDVVIDLSAAPPPAAVATITQAPKVEAPVVAAPAAPPTPPVCIPADCTRAHQVTADDYPPVSLRLQEQGIVEIKYLVGTDGSVQDVQVIKPSGRSRLDEAAVAMVKKRWKFKPATNDGKPVAQWLNAKVTFKLQ